MPKAHFIPTVIAAFVLSLPAAADSGVPKDRQVAADANAKQMLLLMDQDKNGKVSKQEYMGFMEAEFERLDVNKDGELDVDELTKSQLNVHGSGVHR